MGSHNFLIPSSTFTKMSRKTKKDTCFTSWFMAASLKESFPESISLNAPLFGNLKISQLPMTDNNKNGWKVWLCFEKYKRDHYEREYWGKKITGLLSDGSILETKIWIWGSGNRFALESSMPTHHLESLQDLHPTKEYPATLQVTFSSIWKLWT